jgi:6-phospho-3-hexuloisomerase
MGKEPLRSDLFDVLRARLDGIRLLLEDMREDEADQAVEMLLKARAVFVTGKGRSGLVASCFAMRLMQLGRDVHVPDEVTCPRIRRGDLMVAISCSGTTATTLQLARIARDARARIVAITAVPGAPLAELADHVILLPVTGRSVKKRFRYVLGPYNNTLFEEALLLYLDAMVYSILEREGIPKSSLSTRHTNLE